MRSIGVAHLHFPSLQRLNERMKHCDYISHEFYSSTDKWCRANFIVVDRLENGDLNNVIYGVQLIDDEKKKELEYQAALEHALANQNDIYGELLQMQSGGVIAVEIKTNRILVINRALLDMLGIDETKKNQLTHEDFLSHFVDKRRWKVSGSTRIHLWSRMCGNMKSCAAMSMCLCSVIQS